MTNSEIYAGLDEVFKEVFFRDDIVLTPELTADDVEGWTSFKQVEIILAAEERFGVRLASREIDGLKNVGDLANLIAGKTT